VRGALPILCLLATVAAAGCGNERTQPPDVDTPDAPVGERTVRLAEAGVRFTAPGNWPDIGVEEPRIGGIRSGRATVAIWRYARDQELPGTRAELERVRELLLERVRARDRKYDSERASIVRRGGAPGIELLGDQTIAGSPARTRSTHLFTAGREYVIDAYAHPHRFEELDESVFLPLLRSLRIGRR
jgi:hypothetical protein